MRLEDCLEDVWKWGARICDDLPWMSQIPLAK